MKRIASIDLGSNAFMATVADIEGNQIVQVQKDYEKVVRLGEGVNRTRAFKPEALERAKICLQYYLSEFKRHGVEQIVAVSTSAARDAKNSSELVRLGESLGIRIQIISGDREAELSFEGTCTDLPEGEKSSLIFADIGGGSTEIVQVNENQKARISLDVGTVRITEMFGSKVELASQHCQSLFKPVIRQGCKHMVLASGTAVALFNVEHGIKGGFWKAHGGKLGRSRVEKFVGEMSKMTTQEIMVWAGIEERRADVLLGGALIIEQLLRAAQLSEFKISTRGLRYGVLLHWREFL